jgi:hypothetical protein
MPQAPGWPVNQCEAPELAVPSPLEPAPVRHAIRRLWASITAFLRPRPIQPRLVRPWKAVLNFLVYADAGATFRRLIPYLGALASLAFIAVYLFQALPRLMDLEAEPVDVGPDWVRVNKPFPAFSLPMSEWGNRAQEYRLHRHVHGGGRRDTLVFGERDGTEPYLSVEVYRPGGEFSGFFSAEREIASRFDGMQARAFEPAGFMDTKFGEVDLVRFSLKPQRPCLGFVRANDEPALQIVGWYCVSAAVPAPEVAACALDRLTLIAAASEPALRALFARTELKRTFCGQRNHLYAPTPKLGPSAHGPAKWGPVRREGHAPLIDSARSDAKPVSTFAERAHGPAKWGPVRREGHAPPIDRAAQLPLRTTRLN